MLKISPERWIAFFVVLIVLLILLFVRVERRPKFIPESEVWGVVQREAGKHNLEPAFVYAIAMAESGHVASNQNCITIPQGTFAHLGLFQIQNPTHIDNDIAAGNIRASSVITNHTPCPGIRVSTDYFVPSRNIAAAIRISQRGQYWGAWQTFTEKTYLEILGLTCFGA